MVRTKKMDEGYFARLIKDFNSFGELVRARQDEKQALLNQFDAQCRRFFFGKISEKALASSVKKANNELQRLDKDIRTAILHAKGILDRMRAFVARQAPEFFRATLSGISGGQKKKAKKKAVKKKVVKKKAPKKKAKKKTKRKVAKRAVPNIKKILKKEKKLDKKFSKKK